MLCFRCLVASMAVRELLKWMKVDTGAPFLNSCVITTWVAIAQSVGLRNTDGMFSVPSASVRQVM